MGPNKETHTQEQFGEWLDEQDFTICFVKELTKFDMEGLDNLTKFSNARCNNKGKILETVNEALLEHNPIIIPTACFVDWDKFFGRTVVDEFPYFVKQQYGVHIFDTKWDVLQWVNSSKTFLCAWPTEVLYPKEEYEIPDNDITDIVSVANGLCAIHKAIINPDLENFFFIDISSRQLEFTEWLIKNWDGVEPFHIFQKRFTNKNIIPNRKWMYETANMTVEEIQDALIRMQNATFTQANIISYKHNKPAIYYVSNAIDYWFRALEHPIEVLKQQEEDWCKDKEIVFLSHKILQGTLL